MSCARLNRFMIIADTLQVQISRQNLASKYVYNVSPGYTMHFISRKFESSQPPQLSLQKVAGLKKKFFLIVKKRRSLKYLCSGPGTLILVPPRDLEVPVIGADHLGEPADVLLQHQVPRHIRLSVGVQRRHVDLQREHKHNERSSILHL